MAKETITTSIRVNPELWREVKIYCAQNDLDISDFIDRAIKRLFEALKEAKEK